MTASHSPKLSAVGYEFLYKEQCPNLQLLGFLPTPSRHTQAALPAARPYPLETGPSVPPRRLSISSRRAGRCRRAGGSAGGALLHGTPAMRSRHKTPRNPPCLRSRPGRLKGARRGRRPCRAPPQGPRWLREPGPAAPGATHGVQRSLYSLAMVSMPPLRATPM